MSANWYFYMNLPPTRWILKKDGESFYKSPLARENRNIYTYILWFTRFYKGYNFYKLQQTTHYSYKYYNVCYKVWGNRIKSTTNKRII